MNTHGHIPSPDGLLLFLAFGVLVFLAVVKRKPRAARMPRAGRRTGLDTPLWQWTETDSLTVRSLLAGGLHAFGRTDSGKTSSLKSIAKAILRHARSALLVMCAKEGEAKDWLKYCADAGRSGDVVLIAPDQKWRFNMIGYEADRGGEDATNQIVRFISEMRSVILREQESTGGDSSYWRKQEERGIAHAVTVLLIARKPITPQSIHDVIMTAPVSGPEMQTEEWQKKACNQALREAHDATKTAIQEHDFNLARDFFTSEWPTMADRTRASVLVGVMGTLTAMNTGMCRELFANYSNITPKEAIENGKIVIVNLPPDIYGDLGRIANVGWKYHWQREVLRRRIKNDSPIACIWGDESSLWVSSSDASYLSRCRSYRGCMVYICQSLDNYREVLPGEKGKSSIEAMLANFSQKLIFALGDFTTAEWAANLCGKELQQFGGGGISYPEWAPMQMNGKPQYMTNFSEHFEYLMQPGKFLNGFRTGSPVNKFMVDALLVRSGRPFSNGLPIIKVQFDQRS